MKHEILKAKYKALIEDMDTAIQRATADLTNGKYALLEPCQSIAYPDETIDQFEVLPEGVVEIITHDIFGEDQSYQLQTDLLCFLDLLYVLEQIETDKIKPHSVI